jgi:hypothetical protein
MQVRIHASIDTGGSWSGLPTVPCATNELGDKATTYYLLLTRSVGNEVVSSAFLLLLTR